MSFMITQKTHTHEVLTPIVAWCWLILAYVEKNELLLLLLIYTRLDDMENCCQKSVNQSINQSNKQTPMATSAKGSYC